MSARIAVLDIERISAIVQDVWGLGERKYISPDSIIEPSRTICLSWKWLDDPKIHFAAEWDKGGHEGMIAKAHQVLDEATHVVGWNSKSFDCKHLRSHFLQYDMTPPSPHIDVDLLVVMRRHFSFLSNRMSYVASTLGLDGKAEHHGLWKDLRSDKKGTVKRAQQLMKTYNCRDVELTEELFYLLRPWVNNLNIHAFEDVDTVDPKCPNCTGTNLQRRGSQPSRTRVYQRYHCQDCGKWSKGTKSVSGVEIAGI